MVLGTNALLHNQVCNVELIVENIKTDIGWSVYHFSVDMMNHLSDELHWK